MSSAETSPSMLNVKAYCLEKKYFQISSTEILPSMLTLVMLNKLRLSQSDYLIQVFDRNLHI